MPCFPKSLTGAVPTQEALPLLLSKLDAHTPPANFRGRLSKSSQEPTLSSCSGRLPYPRTAGEDGASEEAPTWSRSLSLGRTPRAERLCSVPAVPCTAPSPHLSTQHILPITKGGQDPFRSNTGPLGDGSCGEKSPLTYSGRCLSLSPYPAPQGSPCPMASGAQPHRQLSVPPRGSEGDRVGGGHQVCLNYCNNDMFFNLYPLR